MASKPSSTAPVKRACDSCHRRKIKCIGEARAPCNSCVYSRLACTYKAIPQQKGPKGSRGKVLSELRETQRNAQLAPGFLINLPPATFALTQGLLSPPLVESCIEYFFTHIQPLEPVMRHQMAQEATVSMACSAEPYCMIAALCAYVMIQGNFKPTDIVPLLPDTARMSEVDVGRTLLEESERVRQGYDHREKPTHMSVLTSWFYSGCYHGLAKKNKAWTYLQEAITQAQLLGMHDEETYMHDDLCGISEKCALYCLLLINERTYALHSRLPFTSRVTIHFPISKKDSQRPSIPPGMKPVMDLVNVIDDTFVNNWNQVRNTQVTAAWISKVQTQLSEAVPAEFKLIKAQELPTQLDCSDAQILQAHVTQHWLKTRVWEIERYHRLSSSVSHDIPPMSELPMIIARDLLTMLQTFSSQSIVFHSVGLVEKLYDIASTLVIAVVGKIYELGVIAPEHHDMCQLLNLISKLHHDQSRYFSPLWENVSTVLWESRLCLHFDTVQQTTILAPIPYDNLLAYNPSHCTMHLGGSFNRNISTTPGSHEAPVLQSRPLHDSANNQNPYLDTLLL